MHAGTAGITLWCIACVMDVIVGDDSAQQLGLKGQ